MRSLGCAPHLVWGHRILMRVPPSHSWRCKPASPRCPCPTARSTRTREPSSIQRPIAWRYPQADGLCSARGRSLGCGAGGGGAGDVDVFVARRERCVERVALPLLALDGARELPRGADERRGTHVLKRASFRNTGVSASGAAVPSTRGGRLPSRHCGASGGEQACPRRTSNMSLRLAPSSSVSLLL